MILSVRSMGLGGARFFVSDWAYQVLATTCQAGWVLALYALGRVSRRQHDGRTTWEAIRDAYRGLTFAQYMAGRWQNVREQGLILGISGR